MTQVEPLANGPFPSTPEGEPTPAFGERSGAPSGLRPSSFVMCTTPVEVQFITSAWCLNYPCRHREDRMIVRHRQQISTMDMAFCAAAPAPASPPSA
jgi:hypothetical protein